MQQRIRIVGVGFAVLAMTLLAGCKTTGSARSADGGGNVVGPDFIARANYESASSAGGLGGGSTIAVRVRDGRIVKGDTRPDGREVIAKGDKAKIFLPHSPAVALRDGMIAGLKKQGFRIVANAPVVLDVELRRMDLRAYQFTHWNLPTERASTLDAIGALLPGPTRPTAAATILSATVRKHDQTFGYNHFVEKRANGASTEESIVTRVLSRSMTNAIDELIARAGTDVRLAAKLPVTDAEFQARNTELEARIATLERQKQALESGQVTKADLEALRQEKARLSAALSQRDRELNQLQAAIAGRERESQRLQTQIRRIQSASDAAASTNQARLGVLEREVTRLEGEQQGLSNQLSAVRAQKQETLASFQEATQREITLDRLNRKLKVELSASKAEVERLNTRINKMLQTKQAFSKWKAMLAGRTEDVKPPAGVVAYLKSSE